MYDFTTGLVTSSTDANGYTTAFNYDDPLNRLKFVTRPAGGGWTAYEYNRNAFGDYVHEQTAQSASVTLSAYRFYDGLGRPSRSFIYDPQDTTSPYLTTNTQYDATGRVKRVSNPYRTTGSDSDPNAATVQWTTSQYDALGRVITVTTPDNAQVVSSYSGNQVTVTDQANKSRRSVTDALGRLTSIVEDPHGVPYQTDYTYDGLGNLRLVAQGLQRRYFMYDSLSRLLRASNPEQATNSALALNDPVTGHSQWSMQYVYDANGNLTARTDARNIVTTYAYDHVNRSTDIRYSDGPTIIQRIYDSAVNGRGRLRGTFKYATAVTTQTAIDSYDAMGRALTQRQLFDHGAGWEPAYATGQSYDLAGNVISQTYPSGRVITTNLDGAGRVSSVTGVKSGETNKTYATSFTYAAHGGVASMQLGNNLWEHTNFNLRLQPTQIGLGTSSADSSTLQLDYAYGVATNNGNVASQTITIPGGPTLTQSYTYDALNRLEVAQEQGVVSWKQRFIYDRYGNRNFDPLETTIPLPLVNPAINPANNRLQGYGYDAAGNVTGEPSGSTYAYDAENRQVSYNSGAASYAYNGDGQRVKKVAGSVTTYFVYNVAGQMVAEYAVNSVPGDGGTSYLTADTLGSPRIITDASGGVKARHDYLPFGEELFAGVGGRTIQQGYSQFEGVRQKFTSKERDDETGLDYFLARYYSSTQGRFTSPDEFKGGPDELFVLGSGDEEKQALPYADITNPQSLNKYQFVLNNPMRYVDPDGHQDQDPNQKKGVIDSISDYVGSLVRTLLRQTNPTEEPQESRPPGPFSMDGDKVIERHSQMVGQGTDTFLGTLEFADRTGGVGALRAYAKNDKVGIGVSLSMGALNFATPTKALGHFRNHAAEWGAGQFANALQYVKGARNLIGSKGSDVVRYVNSTGKSLIYNKKTNEMATHTGKTIHTFFRPKRGQAYIDDEIKKNGYKEVR
ncbi:MAG: hypothetical protein M3458_04765 [Acidobacteriota bacterium]|nr:hypothetical protein [Acidobacteriota bacterium]